MPYDLPDNTSKSCDHQAVTSDTSGLPLHIKLCTGSKLSEGRPEVLCSSGGGLTRLSNLFRPLAVASSLFFNISLLFYYKAPPPLTGFTLATGLFSIAAQRLDEVLSFAHALHTILSRSNCIVSFSTRRPGYGPYTYARVFIFITGHQGN